MRRPQTGGTNRRRLAHAEYPQHARVVCPEEVCLSNFGIRHLEEQLRPCVGRVGRPLDDELFARGQLLRWGGWGGGGGGGVERMRGRPLVCVCACVWLA